MTLIDQYTGAYLVGIGGISMSSIARWLMANGVPVAGYDRTESATTSALVAEGAIVQYTDEPALLPTWLTNLQDEQAKKGLLVIYTPAVPTTSKLMQWFNQNGFEILKRSRVLGLITEGKPTWAVAGTHGKTTTSTLLAHIQHEAKTSFTAFLGGIATGYETNLLMNGNDCFLVEADEFDRSFLQLSPTTAIITNTDADHLDIYGTHAALQEAFNQFAMRVLPGGKLLTRFGIGPFATQEGVRTYTYGFATEGTPDFAIGVPEVVEGRMRFSINTPTHGLLERIELGLPGLHNMENAAAALGAALLNGIDLQTTIDAVGSFQGVKRRFQYIINRPGMVYIDDYAHHPTEIASLVQSVRMLYPAAHILGVFQPHLYSRTRDFALGFTQALNLLDEVILLPIYPAREEPIEGVSSSMLMHGMRIPAKEMGPAELLGQVQALQFDVLLTIGAGDIDRLVQPLTNLLNNK